MLKSRFLNPLLGKLVLSWNWFERSVTRNVQKVRVNGTVNLNIGSDQIKMFSNWDDGIVDSIYFGREDYDELNTILLFKAMAKRSNTILDVGANTGIYSLISKKVNPNAEVYSFEPYPINRNRLIKNIDINGMNSTINVEANVVGNTNDMVEFTVPSSDQICDALSVDSSFTKKYYSEFITYKQVKMNQIRLDDFVKEKSLEKVDLIKIDVENYELSVLLGALTFLKDQSPIIFIESFIDKERAEFFNTKVAGLGYHFYGIFMEGIYPMKNISSIPEVRNFVLTKKTLAEDLLPFSDMESICDNIL